MNVETLELWHSTHDAFVAEHGDEERPAACRCADAAYFTLTNFVQIRPGTRWLVDDPTALMYARGLMRSGAFVRAVTG